MIDPEDTQARLRADFAKVIRNDGVHLHTEQYEMVMNDLIDAAMHHILAAHVEPDPGDASANAAFIHGSLYMHCVMHGINGLAVKNVEQLTDEDGKYLHYFTIVTASGTRIRVLIEPEVP